MGRAGAARRPARAPPAARGDDAAAAPSSTRLAIFGQGTCLAPELVPRARPKGTRPAEGVATPRCNTDPMAQPATRNLGRLSEIAQVAVRHGFGYWFDTHRLTDLFPRRTRMELDGQRSQRGQHLREMLDELGPTFVKFGQLLSTRPDVLPPDIITELRGLQDDVRPFPFAQVEQVVEEDLGLTLDKLFTEFEEKPVAAASIGQVHRARLPNGRRV